MSRGPGAIQRKIIADLDTTQWWMTAGDIARMVYDRDEPTPAQKSSVRRALLRLHGQGYILKKTPDTMLGTDPGRVMWRSKKRRRNEWQRRASGSGAGPTSSSGGFPRLAKLLGMLGSAHPPRRKRRQSARNLG
jgi:hypothetical protein